MISKTLLGVALCALIAPFARAGEVYIPDNVTNTGTGDNVLFGPGDLRYQFNLIRGEVGPNSAHQKITELAFVPLVSGTFTATWCQIRMGHGYTLALKNCFQQNMPWSVVVYEGPLTFNAVKDTWSAIGLQRPYATDGSSNVVVEIRYRGGSATPIPMRTSTNVLGGRIFDNTSSDPYNSPCAKAAAENRIPRTRITINNKNVMLAPDHNHINVTNDIKIVDSPPLSRYFVAASFGQGTNGPIDLGACKVWLDFDALLFITLTNPQSALFSGYQGLIGPNGSSSSIKWYVPNSPALIGLCIAHAAVFLDRTQPIILGCTNTGVSDVRL